MKGKLLQRLIAVVLVLCMTATNFIFVAANAVYALSGTTELEGGNIVFEAYFKNDGNKTTQKTAKISEGEKLYVSLELKAGKLKDAKIKIDNANFTIVEEKVNNKFIDSINAKTNEIALKEISYNDSKDGVIEIELPIKFQEADKIDVSYFDMENSITLSGNYINSSENGTDIQSEPLTTRLVWSEENPEVEWPTPKIEKVVYFENKTLVEFAIESRYTGAYFPKETEKITVNVPKINEINPSYTVLVDGEKLDNSEITDSISDEKISFTSNFKENDQITWKKDGNVYKVIYVYDGLERLEDNIEINANIEAKILNSNKTHKGNISYSSNEEKGTIASNVAETLSDEVYKGYMYANSEETTYSEKYDMEISYKDGATATLEFVEDNFKTAEGTLTTNAKTVYKQLEINKEKLQKVLGEQGTLKVLTDNGEILVDASSSTNEAGNIVINSDKLQDSHNIKIEVTSAANEGTIEIVANKAIKGNADYDKETLKTINALETTVKSYTNYDERETTSTISTELKETTTEATLTMSNNNILSANVTNEVEFQATLRTGTMDTDLLKEPTIKILLPKEVANVELTSVSALYAEKELQISTSEVIDENEVKAILVKLDGEQINYNNKFIEGIKITINTKISLNDMVTSRDTEIEMKYTNENSSDAEYTTKIPVSVQAQYGLITKSKINTDFTSENEGTETISFILLNNYDKAINDLTLMGLMPKNAISNDNIRVSMTDANIEIKYSKDGKNWTDSVKDAQYFQITLVDSKLEVGERFAMAVTMDIQTIMATFKIAYVYDAEEKVQDLVIDEIASTASGTEEPTATEEPTNTENPTNTEEPTNTEQPEEIQQNLTVKMIAKTGSKELTDETELYEGQSIVYIYTIKNNTGKDIENVKINANHQGANVFEDITEEDINTAGYTEKLPYTYQRETDKSEKEIEIGTIKQGQTREITYQVRVKDNVEQLKTTAKVSGKDIEDIEINAQNTVKDSELKLELTSNRAKEYPISKSLVLPTILKVTNNTNNLMEDVLININIPKEFKLFKVLDVDTSDETIQVVSQTKGLIILSVDELAAKNSKSYVVSFVMEADPSSDSVELRASSTINGVAYNSNELEVNVEKSKESKVEVKQTSNINEDTVKTGDNLTYTITLKNVGNATDVFSVSDYVPEAATIKKAYYKIGEQDTQIKNLDNNAIVEYIEIKPEEEAIITIETQVDESKTGRESITNYATISGSLLAEQVKTNEVTYKLQANVNTNNDNPEDPNNDPENPSSKPENPTTDPTTTGTVEIKGSISGVVWVDANKNGIREETEKRLSGIKVALGNVSTGKYVTDENGDKLEVTTNADGEYKFENISNGKYMVVFTYDNTKYRNTEYQVKGATEKTNSDIITSKLSSSNDDIKYGITDTLELNGKSLEYIDAGFIENEIFDLSLEKTISKVIIQNASGTTVKEYDNEKLAKLEIDARNLAGSTLLVEYKIMVKNEGEIAGYANEIVDYMPKDLTFNSEMNSDWYISTDGNAHTTALSKELINPGETKTVTLTLVKTMTENNTGLTSNTAEIAKSSNELSIPDKDSKAANNIKGEDDISTAELIVSVRTGIEFTIGIIITLIALGVTGIAIYTKVRKEANHE